MKRIKPEPNDGRYRTAAVQHGNELLKYHERAMVRELETAEDFDEACDFLDDWILNLCEEERIEANWTGDAPHPSCLTLEEDTSVRQCTIANLVDVLTDFDEPDYDSDGPSHDADAQAERRQMGII